MLSTIETDLNLSFEVLFCKNISVLSPVRGERRKMSQSELENVDGEPRHSRPASDGSSGVRAVAQHFLPSDQPVCRAAGGGSEHPE